MNWDTKHLGTGHYSSRQGHAYSVEEKNGHVSWVVNGNGPLYANGYAESVADAKVQCDAARLLMECVALLGGHEFEGDMATEVMERLEPFLVEARALQEGGGA